MFSKKFIASQIVFLVLLAVGVFYAAYSGYYTRTIQAQKLPVLGKVNDFTLTDADGHPFGLKDLKGKVWIADFMFTTCSGICPMMTRNMQKAYNQFETDDVLRFVSVSVNPENDSPDVLKKYTEKYGIDNAKWLFLTGSREDIQKLAVESFKLGDVKEPVFHSAKFALVDKKGRIRGYYDGTEDKAVQQLLKDIARLRKEG